MALINCKECGKEVSTGAKSCPHCGTRSFRPGPGIALKIFGAIIFLMVIGKMLSNDEQKDAQQDHGANGSPASAESDPPTKEPFKESRKNALADLLRKKFAKKHWKATVDTYDDDSILVNLNYRNLPDGYAVVEHDTKTVARFILDHLLKEGRHPAKEGFMVWVYGQRPEKGETGEALVRQFGKTRYDPNDDQLIWEPN